MNTSAIYDCIEGYDKLKGISRIFWDEKHISELRAFFQGIVGSNILLKRDLTAKEHLNLVHIVLGKKNWNGSRSSVQLDGLARQLGGMEALCCLRDNKLLTGTNVLLMEKYQPWASVAAKFIALVEPCTDPDNTILPDVMPGIHFMSLGEKLEGIKKLLEARTVRLNRNALLLLASTGTSTSELLALLNRHGLYTDSNIESLLNLNPKDNLIHIKTILLNLEDKLVRADNFEALLKCANLDTISEITTGLKLSNQLNQSNLSVLFTHADSLKNQPIKDIIHNFHHAQWDIAPHLEAILTNGTTPRVKNTTSRLGVLRSKVTTENDVFMLEAAFTTPPVFVILMEALKILLNASESISEEDQKIILGSPEFSCELALAITVLKEQEAIYTAAKTLACSIPKYAHSMAKALKQLIEANLCTSETRHLLQVAPERAEETAAILQCLRRNNLFEKKYFKNSQAHIDPLYMVCPEFGSLLFMLDDAKMLNQKLFRNLVLYFEPLVKAYTYLKENHTLNTKNLKLIFEAGACALSLARVLELSDAPEPSRKIDHRVKQTSPLTSGEQSGSMFKKKNHAHLLERALEPRKTRDNSSSQVRL